VSERVMNVAWYRFVSTFARRCSGYLSIVLLVGLVGGIGLGSIAMARRTQSSFSTFLAGTNPSDLSLSSIDAPNATKYLERLPWVERVESYDTSINVFRLNAQGVAVIPPAFATGDISQAGSVDGEFFNQDRVAVTAGRLADPTRSDEFDATAQAEKLLDWHVGEVLPIGFFSNGSVTKPGFGTTKIEPQIRLNMKLVGTIVLNNEVVLDDVDRYPTFLLFTPAATRPFLSGSYYGTYALKLKDGAAGVSTVESEIVAALPAGTTYEFHVTSIVEGQVDRTVRPEAIALGVFGSIATLAALLIALQIISRQLRVREEEYRVLREHSGPVVQSSSPTGSSASAWRFSPDRCSRSESRSGSLRSLLSVQSAPSIQLPASHSTSRCLASDSLRYSESSRRVPRRLLFARHAPSSTEDLEHQEGQQLLVSRVTSVHRSPS
jgi:hypothetical protein